MKMLLALAASGLACLVLTLTAAAAPVAYNEAIDGDLPGAFGPTSGPLPQLAFDVGANTVSGTLPFTDAGADFDSFAFIVPAGKQVTLASLTISDTTGDITEAAWSFNQGSGIENGGTLRESVNTHPPDVYTFTTTPFDADTYNISQNTLARTFGADANASYTFSFTVANVVPEPAILSVVAFTAFAFLRRSRRATSRA